jgi:uncharacterized protein (TIGR03066 family)
MTTHSLIAGLIMVGLMLPLPAAPVPKAKAKTTEEKLLGTWQLVGGSQGEVPANRLHLTFLQNGKLQLKQNVGLRSEYLREGTYKVMNDEIHYEVTTPGFEKSEVLRIKKLTDQELSFVDPEDIREDFVRPTKPKN